MKRIPLASKNWYIIGMDIPVTLDTNEKKLWKGKPDKSAFIVHNWMLLALSVTWILGLIAFIIIWPFDVQNAGSLANPTLVQLANFFVYAAVFITLGAPGFLFLIAPLLSWAEYKNIDYILTSKRLFILGGVFTKETISIEYSDINSVELNVDFVDKVFNNAQTGSIVIKAQTPKGPRTFTLSSLKYPEDVFKILKNNTAE